MPAHHALETTMRADGHLVLLDVLSDQGETGSRRRRVRVRCKLCGTRKSMLRQTALLATSCGCLRDRPESCGVCGRSIVKRGLAAHIEKAHRPHSAPEWWAKARRLHNGGMRVAAIAREVGKSHAGVTYALGAA